MGIGMKATDQRTPCRKFLATPLAVDMQNSIAVVESTYHENTSIAVSINAPKLHHSSGLRHYNTLPHSSQQLQL